MMEDEKDIITACKKRLKGQRAQHVASGVVMDLYQFTNDEKKTWKDGQMFHATQKKRISFHGGQCGLGHIKADNKDNTRHAGFLIGEQGEQQKLEDVMERGLTVKHIGILKPYIVAYNNQLSKMVSGYGVCNYTLGVWLGHQRSKSIPRGPYLSNEEKEILRSACMAIDLIWSKGYTSDVLADLQSYVMMGQRIKILPSSLRPRQDIEISMMPLRNAFADMINTHIFPVWGSDVEITDFILLLRNPIASVENILGHPILLTPSRRQLMYHTFHVARLTSKQKIVLPQKIQMNNWQINLKKDSVFDSIIKYQAGKATKFSTDVSGALHFASVSSAHYVNHLKELYKERWYSLIKSDTVDKYLKESLPRLLTSRYVLKFDPDFCEN